MVTTLMVLCSLIEVAPQSVPGKYKSATPFTLECEKQHCPVPAKFVLTEDVPLTVATVLDENKQIVAFLKDRKTMALDVKKYETVWKKKLVIYDFFQTFESSSFSLIGFEEHILSLMKNSSSVGELKEELNKTLGPKAKDKRFYFRFVPPEFRVKTKDLKKYCLPSDHH